ncbi:MAG TPA: BON domain-containing protein [Gemmatimonadaceae bacterium]|nr:BON domain-containing protein [Gemmatimonadaceae bacterium]
MANEFERIHDIDDLDDGELRDLIRAQLRANNGLDVDYITVKVDAGRVTLEGRVGTDYERRVAEHVLTDVLGLTDVTNDLVVQAIHRAETPMEIFDHLVEEDRESGLLLGDRPVPMDPEADDVKEDLDARMFGTTDIGKAIADGTPWVPPESSTQEGLEGPGLEGPNAGPSPGEDH